MLNIALQRIRDRVGQNGRIGDPDVAEARRFVYSDEIVSPEDIEGLFAIEQARTVHNPEWSAFFREALVDIALNQTPPAGYLSEDNADLLIRSIGERKDARSDTALEALADIVEKAREVPPKFSAFVLRQVKSAAIYADGVDANGRPLRPGAIGMPEIRYLQRILWGAESVGMLAISREEAEALFDIADATAGANNDPAWTDLFARAIGNYLLGATGRQAISRQAALQAWETPYESNVVSALAGLVGGVGTGFRSIFRTLGEGTGGEELDYRIAVDELARARATEEAANLQGEKAEWLLDRVRRNGLLTGPERALLDFVQQNAALLTPELRALVDDVGKQAQAPAKPAAVFGRRGPGRAA